MYTGPLDTELVESMNDCDPEVCILMVKGGGTLASLSSSLLLFHWRDHFTNVPNCFMSLLLPKVIFKN